MWLVRVFLTTLQAKMASGQYRSPAECADDVRLIWNNCMLYNQDGSEFYKLAKKFANRCATHVQQAATLYS